MFLDDSLFVLVESYVFFFNTNFSGSCKSVGKWASESNMYICVLVPCCEVTLQVVHTSVIADFLCLT
jgi:hypothetical protein